MEWNEFLMIIVLPLITAGFLGWQVWAFRRQYKNDHERSRREVAIDLQKFWMSSLNMRMRLAREIIPLLSLENCTDFWNNKSFKITNRACMDTLKILFDKQDLSFGNGGISIEGKHLAILRTDIISYLNVLEVVFTAWLHHIGEREMIEAEFGKNITKDDRTFPYENIVNATQIFFPSIKAYIAEIRSRNTPKTNGKPQTGK